MEKRPKGYEAAKAAICGALRCKNVTGTIIPIYRSGFEGGYEIEDSIDVEKTRLQVGSLKKWLAGRGFKTGFFFPEGSESPDYLDPSHPRYAPKLAAAVLAWQATGDEAALKGKSPEQALVKWLREHAADFALTDDEGKPNEMGIEETAKVANWQPTGGAPKTPSDNYPTPKPMLKPSF